MTATVQWCTSNVIKLSFELRFLLIGFLFLLDETMYNGQESRDRGGTIDWDMTQADPHKL